MRTLFLIALSLFTVPAFAGSSVTIAEPPKPAAPPPANVPIAKPIDAAKPQCANSRKELEENPTLKKALNGYTPFTTWKGQYAEIKYNESTDKMQTIIKKDFQGPAAMLGQTAVTPLPMKVCLDSEGSKPYVSIGGTVYDKLVTQVKKGNTLGSDTFTIETSR